MHLSPRRRPKGDFGQRPKSADILLLERGLCAAGELVEEGGFARLFPGDAQVEVGKVDVHVDFGDVEAGGVARAEFAAYVDPHAGLDHREEGVAVRHVAHALEAEACAAHEPGGSGGRLVGIHLAIDEDDLVLQVLDRDPVPARKRVSRRHEGADPRALERTEGELVDAFHLQAVGNDEVEHAIEQK